MRLMNAHTAAKLTLYLQRVERPLSACDGKKEKQLTNNILQCKNSQKIKMAEQSTNSM